MHLPYPIGEGMRHATSPGGCTCIELLCVQVNVVCVHTFSMPAPHPGEVRHLMLAAQSHSPGASAGWPSACSSTLGLHTATPALPSHTCTCASERHQAGRQPIYCGLPDKHYGTDTQPAAGTPPLPAPAPPVYERYMAVHVAHPSDTLPHSYFCPLHPLLVPLLAGGHPTLYK